MTVLNRNIRTSTEPEPGITKSYIRSNVYNIALNLKQLYYLVPFSFLILLLLLHHIIVLTTRSHLSAAQASPSFKWLDTRTSMSTTPTFITEALCLIT